MRALLAPDGVFVCEVSYAVDIIDKMLLGTIFHEHLSYHAVKPIARFLARELGMKIGLYGDYAIATAQNPTLPDHLDQYMWRTGTLGAGSPQPSDAAAATSDGLASAGAFQISVPGNAVLFSFFLAVPTLVAAGAYDAWSNRDLFAADYLGIVAVGLVTSFVSAFLCIRWLLRFVVSHDFTVIAWYRIVFGVLVLVTAWTGVVDWTAG